MISGLLVAPQRIEPRDFPEPVVPDDGVLLRVKACGVCGSDIRRWREGPPAGVDGIVPGHEAAGMVIAAGKNQTRFQVGDHLAVAPDIHCGECYYCQRGMYNLCDHLQFLGITPGHPGALAEILVLTGEVLRNGIVHKIPVDMPFEDAAFAEPCCSVLATFQRYAIGMSDTMVVLGAGPIGCLFVHLAKTNGARVIVSQRSLQRQQLVERFEPDAILNAQTDDVVSRVRQMTHGRGADVVICANPVAATQTHAVEMVRKGGRVILFGGLPKSNPMTTLDSNKIHYGEIEVVGAFSYHTTIHELALDLIYRQVIPAKKFITDTYEINRVEDAFAAASSGSGLKVMVTMEKD